VESRDWALYVKAQRQCGQQSQCFQLPSRRKLQCTALRAAAADGTALATTTLASANTAAHATSPARQLHLDQPPRHFGRKLAGARQQQWLGLEYAK
jgi:hypothetical protein